MNYAIYTQDADVTTFDGYDSSEAREQLAAAADLFGSAGDNISAMTAPPGASVPYREPLALARCRRNGDVVRDH